MTIDKKNFDIIKKKNNFDFTLVKDEVKFDPCCLLEPGIYSCSSTLNFIRVTSKLKNDDIICKVDMIIWDIDLMNKEDSRDLLLKELGI